MSKDEDDRTLGDLLGDFDGMAAAEAWRKLHPGGLGPSHQRSRNVEKDRADEKIDAEQPSSLPSKSGGLVKKAGHTEHGRHLIDIRRCLVWMIGHSTGYRRKYTEYADAYIRAARLITLIYSAFDENRPAAAARDLDMLDSLFDDINDLSQPARNQRPNFEAAMLRVDNAIDALLDMQEDLEEQTQAAVERKPSVVVLRRRPI